MSRGEHACRPEPRAGPSRAARDHPLLALSHHRRPRNDRRARCVVTGAGATSPVELVLTQLEAGDCRPRRSGRGWSARCPAHSDTSPSLYVSEGDDRKALVRCYVGCDYRSIVQALGLAPRQLFETSTGDVRAVEPRRQLTPAQRVARDVENARQAGAPMRAWEAWLTLGGTIEDAFRDDPASEARSWIVYTVREARRQLDLDTLAGLLDAFGLPFPDDRPGRGGAWYAIAARGARKGRVLHHDHAALARCLDVIDRVRRMSLAADDLLGRLDRLRGDPAGRRSHPTTRTTRRTASTSRTRATSTACSSSRRRVSSSTTPTARTSSRISTLAACRP